MEQIQVKISVIIPIYNMERYLRECLDTVIAQSLREIEIICINDGSTDSSEQIVREYMAKDERVKLISQTNQGVAMARNHGLEQASGEYVAFMDPDDFYPDSEVLRILYDKVQESGMMICGGSFSELTGNQLVTEFSGAKKKYSFAKDEIISYRDYQFDYGYHRFIYNLEFLKENEIFFPPYIRFQDPPFFVKAMITAGQFYAVRKVTYRYRVGVPNIVWTDRKLTDLLKGLRDLLRMSSMHRLKELHCLTLRRFGRNYAGMYAKAMAQASPELIQALEEAEAEIDLSLIYDQEELMQYRHVFQHIIRTGFAEFNAEETVKELEEKIRRLEKSKKEMAESFYLLQSEQQETAQPMVTVIIPVYNVEKYISDCLESVRRQTLKNIEILVVNDGTPDRSMEVIASALEEDRRIRVITKENGGLSSARNAGLQEARGEYVLFLDSDDLLCTDALELLYWRAKGQDLDDLFYSADVFFDSEEAAKSHGNYENYYQRKNDYSGVWKGTALFTSFIEHNEFKPSACLQLLKRSFLEKSRIIFYEGILHEDNLFTMQCLLKALRTGYLDERLYRRRVHEDSIMTEKRGIKNAYGYFVGIMEMIHSASNCGEILDERYLEALERQLSIMGDVAANFIREIPQGDVTRYTKDYSVADRMMFHVLVYKISRMKQEVADTRKSERDRKNLTDKLMQTINQKKAEIRDFQNDKKKALKACEVEKNAEIQRLKAALKQAESENKKNQGRADRLERRLKDQEASFRGSASYRIGRVITFLPRMVKRIFKG